MRQSDGSEILGPNDPRKIVIGIIHVSPNDDRQSVVSAITSQDKQGRDQVILVLPTQNKSFKSAVDFEGLHQMSGELEASIVLVAPEKSKLAGFARREGFTVYSTLDELAQAEFPPLEPDGAPADVAADDEMESTMMFPLEIPHPSDSAPVPPAPQPVSPEKKGEAEEKAVSPAPPTSSRKKGGAVSPAPSGKKEAAADVASPLPSEPSTVSPEKKGEAEVGGVLSDPVVVPPAVPPEEDEDATNPAIPVVLPESPDVQAGVQAPGSYLPVVVPPNANALVPSDSQLPVYYEPIETPHPRSWRGLIITGVTVVVLIGLGLLFYRPILDLFFPPTATVTVMPSSQQLQKTYQITAVLGVPDPTKDQVDARALYADSRTQTQSVKATGEGHIAGQQAQGELTFYNTSASAQTVAAGTVVFDSNGLAVVNGQTVTLPAFDTTGLHGVTVPAHTVNVGSSQNIPAYDFNSSPCCNGTIYVTNVQPFTGGQDQQDFTYVQQSDIDGVVQSMNATQSQQATMALQGQVRTSERSVGSPRCAPQVKSDHRAGESADSVTVSVTTSCVEEVYDMQAVQVLASRKLSQDAAVSPGRAYAPVGEILTQVARATPEAHGNVLLVTNAAGVWAYQFTLAQRAHFASLIAGKSTHDARSILLGQTGVQEVNITLTGVGVTNVPNDINRVTIDIEAVQGLHT